MTATTIDLNDASWDEARDSIARRFLGITADEFVKRYRSGEYDGSEEPDFLMDVLAYFPELD